MQFAKHKFSRRHAEVEAALIVFHQPVPPVGYPLRSTAAALISPDGTYYIGISNCAWMDPFIRKVGRQKAIGRAHQQYLAKQPDGKLDLSNPADAVKELLVNLKDTIDHHQHRIIAEHVL